MIHVDKFRAAYWISARDAAPALVQSRLDDIARKYLLGALSGIVEDALPPGDEDIWMMRRLELDLDLEPSLDDHCVAASWATGIAAELAARLASSETDPDIVHFINRADMLSHYVVDRSAGIAARRWYYLPFAGLAVLPDSAAIRTAVCDDAASGRQALLGIPPSQLPRVVKSLTEADAGAILRRLASTGRTDSAVESLMSVWCDLERQIVPLGDGNRAALLWLMTAARQVAWLGATAATQASALARLAKVVRERPAADAMATVQAAAEGATGRIVEIAGAETALMLASLTGTDAALLAQLLPRRTQQSAPERRYTAFGGLFLLLPLLEDLPVAEFFPGAEPLARLWIVAKCFGPSRAYAFFFDPLVRDLLGVDPDLSPSSFVEWQRRLPPKHLVDFRRALEDAPCRRDNANVVREGDEGFLDLPSPLRSSPRRDRLMSAAAHLLLRAFSWRLAGFSTSSFAHLHANSLDFPASLEDQPQHRVVRVADPPLSVVLDMTGMSRAHYHLSWTDNRPFELYPEA
jgi:hypothetical protein